MAPISKCVEGDHGYHVKGALVVAQERALQYATDQLKRVVDEFEDFNLFIISPVTRYVATRAARVSSTSQTLGIRIFCPRSLRTLPS